MMKEFILSSFHCSVCGKKIETALMALKGVVEAKVNMVTNVLKVQVSDEYQGDISNDVKMIVHKYSRNASVSDLQAESKTEPAQPERAEMARLIIGIAAFAVGVVGRRLFDMAPAVELIIFLTSYALLGGSVLIRAAKNISRGQVFDENFLMSVATLGAFAIGDYAEGAAVMLFYQVGEFFQDLAVRRSKKSITELMDIRPDYANVWRDGVVTTEKPETVAVGELIQIKPGEKIPLDGVITEGLSMLDTSALTGESVPRKAEAGDDVISGSINQSGLLIVKVTKTFGDSTVSKIIDLVENAGSKKAPTENFITTFSRYYTPVVVGLAVLLAVIPPLFFGGQWSDWIQRGLIFLVISCPCALVISIPLGFFGGIGGASRRGILVKGGNYLEALNKLDIVVFDKTGTLTKGVFSVTSISPANGFDDSAVLEYAAKAESFSNHPISKSIMAAYAGNIDQNSLSDYTEIAGHGISVKDQGTEILAGNDKLMRSSGIDFEDCSHTGTKVLLAVDGRYAGCIVISDELKPDSFKAVAGLREEGVRKIVMLTGDNAQIGEAIAGELKLDEVYSQLLPDQKVEMVEKLDKDKRPKGKLAFVGDGINDAPVLARSDIGIAMGGLGSDAAIEAADIVLMTDEPSKLVEAIKVAQKTKRIVWQNIAFALGTKVFFLVLGALGMATMWEAVFADVGVAIISIINAMRIIKA